MTRHRQLNPLCPFVLNPTDSGNVPISNQPTSSEVIPVDYMNEQCRLATFRDWPLDFITPQLLAKAGFYYYNQADYVMCAWCHGVIGKWEIGDDPFTEHQKFFPNCPRVQLGPNIEIASEIRELGIQQIRPPKQEKYASLDARLRTFNGSWPCIDIQDPEILATAGFYFQNVDDEVLCFHCNGGLRSWQKEDDPWFEHAKWFPHCQFVQLVKGEQYVQHVQQKTRPTLEQAMATEPVQQAMQMGLHAGRIRSVTKNRLEKFGKPYASVQALVEAVLDSQHDETEDDDIEQTQNNETITIREVSHILDTIFRQYTPTGSDNNMASTSMSDNNTDTIGIAASELPASSSSSSSTPPPPQFNNESPATTFEQLSLEEENRKLKDARLCKVCMADEVGVVFLPCGHLGIFLFR